MWSKANWVRTGAEDPGHRIGPAASWLFYLLAMRTVGRGGLGKASGWGEGVLRSCLPWESLDRDAAYHARPG